MNSASASVGRSDFRTLLEGQADQLRLWTLPGHRRTVTLNVAVILFGAGLYGATIGWWRDPWQGWVGGIFLVRSGTLTLSGAAALSGAIKLDTNSTLTVNKALAYTGTFGGRVHGKSHSQRWDRVELCVDYRSG